MRILSKAVVAVDAVGGARHVQFAWCCPSLTGFARQRSRSWPCGFAARSFARPPEKASAQQASAHVAGSTLIPPGTDDVVLINVEGVLAPLVIKEDVVAHTCALRFSAVKPSSPFCHPRIKTANCWITFWLAWIGKSRPDKPIYDLGRIRPNSGDGARTQQQCRTSREDDDFLHGIIFFLR